MTPWEEIRKLRSQYETMLAVIHQRIVEASAPYRANPDGTQSVPWVETSSDWAMLKNVRPKDEWTEQQVTDLCVFVRSLGFSRVVIYDIVGKCVHSS